MPAIEAVGAREILDSRGNPTVEVEVALDDGTLARAAVPSGASTGQYEAVELRDGDERYGGKGVRKAVDAVLDVLGPELVGMEATEQRLVDQALLDLDGTPDKGRYGANALLGISLAVARAGADALGLPLFRYVGGPNAHLLPVPMLNILNGGAHADTNVDVQEFMIAPVGAASFAEGLRMGAEVYQALKAVLKGRGLTTSVGDEGGFAPDLPANREALDLILEAVTATGLSPGRDIALALDVAATEFHSEAGYRFEGADKTAEQMTDYYADLVSSLPDRVHRGPAGRERLGRLGAPHRAARGRRADRRRRPVRHQPEPARRRDRPRLRQRPARQGQPDRDAHRDPGRGAAGPPQRLPLHDEPPLRRDRGHHHRRPRGRHRLRADQDRRAGPQRAGRQVQPAAAHRGRARRRRPVRRRDRLPALAPPRARSRSPVVDRPRRPGQPRSAARRSERPRGAPGPAAAPAPGAARRRAPARRRPRCPPSG